MIPYLLWMSASKRRGDDWIMSLNLLDLPSKRDAVNVLSFLLRNTKIPLILSPFEGNFEDERVHDISHIRRLASALQGNDIVSELNLFHAILSSEECGILPASLLHYKPLRKLNYEHNDVSLQGIQLLSDALISTGVMMQELTLTKCDIGPEAMAILAKGLHSNSTLYQFFLDFNPIGDRGMAELGQALHHNKTLETLRLEGNSIFGDGMTAFCKALRINKTLESLSLGGNSIGDNGLIALCSNKTLRYLSVGNTEHDTGICALMKTLQESNDPLRCLSVSTGVMGMKGVQAVAKYLRAQPSSGLDKLYLDNCGLEDDAAQVIAVAFRGNCRLEHLYLYHNKINRSGYESIAEAFKTTIHSSIFFSVRRAAGARKRVWKRGRR